MVPVGLGLVGVPTVGLIVMVAVVAVAAHLLLSVTSTVKVPVTGDEVVLYKVAVLLSSVAVVVVGLDAMVA